MAEIPSPRSAPKAFCVRPLGRGNCAKPVPADAPVPMCMEHMAQAWEYCGNRVAWSRQETREEDDRERGNLSLQLLNESSAERVAARRAYEESLDDPAIDDVDSVVYYVRFAGRIKIGFSRNLGSRLTAIPHDELLTVEPGARKVEARRHRQFAEHRVIGEWFTAAPELIKHIEALKARYAELENWRGKAAEALMLCDPNIPLQTDAEVLARLE